MKDLSLRVKPYFVTILAQMRVFISYSHKDKRWFDRLLVHLKPFERMGKIDVWSDTKIDAGNRWREEIRRVVLASQVAVLLVSADFLASDFIASDELPPLLLAAKRQKCIVVPVILGPCSFSQIQSLQQFQAANSPGTPLAAMRKVRAEEVLQNVSKTIFERASISSTTESDPQAKSSLSIRAAFVGSREVDELIKEIGLADWKLAANAALKVLAKTRSGGQNELFEALLDYQDCSGEDDRFWGATHTVECCLRLAPWLINHTQLHRLASHENYSVRSVAASICMDMARSAPGRVPVDILLRLSIYDEDWYVQAPANAAIKAMARSLPAVLDIFYGRLHSNIAEERSHASAHILSVADKDPDLLDSDLLKRELKRLSKMDRDASKDIEAALQKMKGVTPDWGNRYGL